MVVSKKNNISPPEKEKTTMFKAIMRVIDKMSDSNYRRECSGRLDENGTHVDRKNAGGRHSHGKPKSKSK